MIRFVIGDIHGRLDLLEKLLDCIYGAMGEQEVFKDYGLVFLGDYVDRGPDTCGVLRRIQQLHMNGAVCLQGNHEQMLYNGFRQDGSAGIWDGGIFDSYGGRLTTEFLDHLKFIESLPTHFETDLHYYCHAGIRPDVPLNEQVDGDLQWIRHEFLHHKDAHPKYVFHGHTSTPHYTKADKDGKYGPDIQPNRCNLDTGAVFGGGLTAAMVHPDHPIPTHFIQVWDDSYRSCKITLKF
jgi:serine/threonine protein phosphatase 1